MTTVDRGEKFVVGWGDLDGNQHMANRAFLDRAADTRLRFFAAHGFSATRFAAEKVGPVMARDELVYRRELRLLDEFTVDLEMVGLSNDGVRFAVQNTFRTPSGDVAAVVRSEGVWLDLETRRPRRPPPELEEVQRGAPRGATFREL